jgi:predicted RecA/RadA family phage recombinase
MKTLYGPAGPVKRIAPSGGVTSGVPVMIGTQLVIPIDSAAEGAVFEGEIRGVYFIEKTTGAGTGAAAGVKCYWTTAASKVSALPAGDELLGIFDDHYLLAEVSEEDGAEVQSTAKALWVMSDHLQLGRDVDDGDEVTIPETGKRWGIHRAERDHVGTGVNLVLFELYP